ncbi:MULTISPECIES: TolC family protein [unclassified Fibrobacter]|uniref:TolC family protein n=1 Tax=unclassified Fibrobacter TaxID=2634177 RepID=UPI000D6ABE5A|nr:MULTISPECIES: TolC family protein [unclassified Fibrobacter]PWJ64957.1 outer membrane protein [Fibrobacter sp. UWR4]PZW69022.1 outer membrane protein [Fibrobacter sp. UWR1]
MIKSKATLLSILAATSVALAGSTWTLEQCLDKAKKSSLSLEAAKLKEQAAEISVKQAKSSGGPSVSATIGNTLYDHPLAPHPQDHYRFNVGISGSYTLWDGGSTKLNTEATQLSREAVALATKQTERSIQESVLNAYINLLAAQEKLRTADASVELSQAEFEHYTKLFEAGAITKKDLTQSQSNVLQKQVAQLTAQLNVSTSRTSLRQLLELDANDSMEVSAPEANISSPDSLPPLPAYDQLMTDARAANPGLKSDSISIKAAHKNTEAAGANNSITVTLGANSSTGFTAWESDRYARQLKNGWQNSISLNINIPIIDNGSTENKVLQAQVNEASSQVALQESSKNLENNMEKLYINAMSADMQWKAAALQVEAEMEALAVAEEQRNAGAITYTDYLTQKNNLESAQVTLTNAKYTSILARKLLELYQGKLD